MDTSTKCAAVVQTGWTTKYYEGEGFLSILNKVSEVQDIECLVYHTRMLGTPADEKVADQIENWLYCYEGESDDMHRFDGMDFTLSIGQIKCLGWAEGEDQCKALRLKHKGI